MKPFTARLGRMGMLAASVGLLVAIGFAAPAQAHSFVVDSNPQAGESLTELPPEFSVTANEPLLNLAGGEAFGLLVHDADGLYYGDGCVTVNGATASTHAEIGPAGNYTLTYQILSADAHTVSGSIDFVWDPASSKAVISEGSSTPPVCGEALSEKATAESVPTEPAKTMPMQEGGVAIADALWIAGAIAAVLVAISAATVLLRRKRG
ncbi:MAG: copper resistance protein CopC [Homoserinimonas sp.]|jgi:methionine-rich copper-binding protein CopC|nr:copper resistance protein CopC [Homoserinimonas sp.]